MSEDTADQGYNEGPKKYAASGTRELWVFDPERFGAESLGGPVVLRVYRRVNRRAFKCVYSGEGPAFLRELGAWLVVRGKQLLIADDAKGEKMWPTEVEAVEHELATALERAKAAERALAALRSRAKPSAKKPAPPTKKKPASKKR